MMLILNSTDKKITGKKFSIFSKVKYILSFAYVIFFSCGWVLAQHDNNAFSLRVSCILPNSTVEDNQHVRARITITNCSNNQVVVYKELREGAFINIQGDNKTNLEFTIQKKTSNRYRDYSNRVFIDAVPPADTSDNLKKIRLLPNDSVGFYFQVDSRYKLEPGYYRIKCLYRNDIHKDKGVESRWTYFRVVKTIYMKHYINESVYDSAKRLQ